MRYKKNILKHSTNVYKALYSKPLVDFTLQNQRRYKKWIPIPDEHISTIKGQIQRKSGFADEGKWTITEWNAAINYGRAR